MPTTPPPLAVPRATRPTAVLTAALMGLPTAVPMGVPMGELTAVPMGVLTKAPMGVLTKAPTGVLTGVPTAVLTAVLTGEPMGELTAEPAEMAGSSLGAGWTELDHPASDSSALSRCIGVDSNTFAAEYWGRVPLLSRRDRLPAPFDDLLNLDTADELLSRRGLRTPFLRMAKDGEVVGSAHFTGSGGAGAGIADQVRDDRVAELFADGATIVLQALHRNWPPVIDFVDRLAAELGHPVQANAYLTPPSARGFSAHYDVHDVFVLQLAGRKRWTVHPPVYPDPLRDQPWHRHRAAVARASAEHEPMLDVLLDPGDTLYLPRGYLHAATSQGGTAAHLTVGVHTVTRFALVEALCAVLAQRPELRTALPLGLDVADPGQLAPHLHAVAEHLTAALREVTAVDVAQRVRTQVWAGTRPEPLGPIAQATFAGALRPPQRVRRRAGLRCSLHSGHDDLVLELPECALTLPLGARPALEVLLGGSDVVVGELPGLTDDERLVLVRRLLRAGVLVPARAT